jgi:uncharacterized membrane protein
MGLTFEIVGVKYGMVFGGYYVYNPAVSPSILGVPLLIPLSGRDLSTSAIPLYLLIASGSTRRIPGLYRYRILRKLAFAVFVALVVLAIDLIMEPLQVNAGNWRWLATGAYFNVPTGNFLGWFLVAFFSTIIFTSLQNHHLDKQENIGRQVLLIPVLGYGILCIVFVFWAFRTGMSLLAAIGLFAMAPTVLVNLALFLRWRMRIVE